MPTISMFFGIVIRMYFDDHNPPHFHALYAGNTALYTLDGELLEGNMPSKQHKLIVAWAAIHQEELEANWELASSEGTVFKIDPLR